MRWPLWNRAAKRAPNYGPGTSLLGLNGITFEQPRRLQPRRRSSCQFYNPAPTGGHALFLGFRQEQMSAPSQSRTNGNTPLERSVICVWRNDRLPETRRSAALVLRAAEQVRPVRLGEAPGHDVGTSALPFIAGIPVSLAGLPPLAVHGLLAARGRIADE